MRANRKASKRGRHQQTRKTTGVGRAVEETALATLAEVAVLLNVRPSQVRRLAARGVIPTVRVGRYLRVPIGEARRLLETTSDVAGNSICKPTTEVE